MTGTSTPGSSDDRPWTFDEVLHDELREIAASRAADAGQSTPAVDVPAEHAHDDVVATAHAHQTVGLAFSGGGIRSATFNLGVLQALAEMRLLSRFDYLSTVSGGGYIGSWLSAWIKRHENGLRGVEEDLVQGTQHSPKPKEADPIQFLRAYSNYLTPRLGALNNDTLAAVSAYLRNLILNLTGLIAALAALLLVPRALVLGMQQLSGPLDTVARPWAGIAGIALFGMATVVIALNLMYVSSRVRDPVPWYARMLPAAAITLGAGFTGAALIAWWILTDRSTFNDAVLEWSVVTLLFYLVPWLSAAFVAFISARSHDAQFEWRKWSKILLAAALVGAAGGSLFAWMRDLFDAWSLGAWSPVRTENGLFVERVAGFWMVLGFGTPLVVAVLTLMIAFHIGLVGQAFTEDEREWWSSLGGWFLLGQIVWAALFALVVFTPILTKWGSSWLAFLGPAWIATTVGGILLGKSSLTGRPGGGRWADRFARIAPYVFVVGLLVALAWTQHAMLEKVYPCDEKAGGCYAAWREVISSSMDPETGCPASPLVCPIAYQEALFNTMASLEAASRAALVWWALGLFGVWVLLAWRVDINLFSLHHFYHNRLARCYLGASRKRREPHGITGFDALDDLPIASLWRPVTQGGASRNVYQRPFHLVNTALNLVHGRQLAWQQRKAASFVFTPRSAGYELPPSWVDNRVEGKGGEARPQNSFRPADEYMKPGGIPLGSAMAISGAAASPNMGYHTSPALSFLMTLFDVRLGRWCGNPQHEIAWRKRGPRFSGRYLLSELFGLTNETTPFVYLSDGGHFENLAVYELVRRRCRFIVVSDAGQDGATTFEDLGNMIRKCQIDLGIEIELSVDAMRPSKDTGRCLHHCAVGLIHYERVDGPSAAPGLIVYLKPTLTGNEPTDIANYASAHPDFPHQSTADQWFDEQQFESYRKLGHHLCSTVFATAALDVQGRPRDGVTNEELFQAVREQWYPPAPGDGLVTGHSQALQTIYEQIRTAPQLAFLDAQIYPEWPALAETVKPDYTGRLWLPETMDELRAGFYLCSRMIELMEDVYRDLRLEDNFDHPDNRGWMNLFRHWTGSAMLQAAWAVTASTFEARFQRFCEWRLGLSAGEVTYLETPWQIRAQTTDALEASMLVLDEMKALNPVERGLLRDFARSHADVLAGGAHLFILQTRLESGLPRSTADTSLPAPDARPGLRFSFGFALAREVDGELEMLYFRIQDHLRMMGLGRKALRLLMRDRPFRPLHGVRPMPEGATEATTDAGVERFRRMYRSAWFDRNRPA